jgi:hypothetical protein
LRNHFLATGINLSTLRKKNSRIFNFFSIFFIRAISTLDDPQGAPEVISLALLLLDDLLLQELGHPIGPVERVDQEFHRDVELAMVLVRQAERERLLDEYGPVTPYLQTTYDGRVLAAVIIAHIAHARCMLFENADSTT